MRTTQGAPGNWTLSRELVSPQVMAALEPSLVPAKTIRSTLALLRSPNLYAVNLQAEPRHVGKLVKPS